MLNDHMGSKKKEVEKMKQYYYLKTNSLSNLETGEEVWFKKTPEIVWSPAKVKSKCVEPRSYILETRDGYECRRNRQHIMKIPSPAKTPDTPHVSQACGNVPAEEQMSPSVQTASDSEHHQATNEGNPT